ncbi:uncharacterized protein LOC123533833 [Mercenaria mercenaria]|uniref:uncharacterized protein LOC123533833 n=1 Tax=Mercenaria mercenaria TaxID=6596 RepID=UPI00234F9561|nr:uncharacterized protein LOC123533833 [Mercenaria mercenaria]
MNQVLRRVVIFLCWTFILFDIASCLTCGQTKCSDGEQCCSKNGGSNNCCCKNDATGTSHRCFSETITGNGFPWWGAVIIVIVIVAIIATVVFILYRIKRRQPHQPL